MPGRPRKTIRTNTVIIGAGAAGLAVGACLRRNGIPFVILEKDRSVGNSWMQRYDRLHLHTHRRFSSLPYLSFPRHTPAYPSRIQLADYLERYAQCFQLEPRFGEKVRSVMRIGSLWSSRARTADFLSRNLVIATGYSHTPYMPKWEGVSTFPGTIVHSSRYENGKPFEDQHVLVVGFGNSGGEIAMDLHEHHARVSLAVRGPVNVVPRDVFGISSHAISVCLKWLPPSVADSLSKPLTRMQLGDVASYGLEPAGVGPLEQIVKHDRVPLLDAGTMQLIRQGHIQLCKGIERIQGETITFTDGASKMFDAIVLATGYRHGVGSFLRDVSVVAEENGRIKESGAKTALPGLYFCGFNNAPRGLLREIGIEAKRIARILKKTDTSIPKEKKPADDSENLPKDG